MATDLIALALDDVGEHFARYRLRSPAMERVLEASLRRYGQMSPVVPPKHHDRYELVDGFKRLAAARAVREIATLCARVIERERRWQRRWRAHQRRRARGRQLRAEHIARRAVRS